MKDSAPLPSVLILGSDAAEADAMGRALNDKFECHHADTLAAALTVMTEHFVHVAICACKGASEACTSAFDAITARWPETMLVLVTDEPERCVDGLDLQHVLPRPWHDAELCHAVGAAARIFRLARENERLSLEMRCLGPTRPNARQSAEEIGFESILRVAGSPMGEIVNTARQYAVFDVPILLSGEPGTGKASMARAIHEGSLRSGRVFQTLDLVGLSEEAVTLALFGRRKPANGAPAVNKTGLLRKTDQGTLFLSGLETLSHRLQMRLLRFLRDGQFEAEGTGEPEQSGARLIAATSIDPRAQVEAGTLDPALYFALSIAELALPALRERTCDIPLLARVIADETGRRHGKPAQGLGKEAVAFLKGYTWPGNLSELENEITRMIIKAQDAVLGPDLLSRHILQASPVRETAAEDAIMTAQGALKDRVEAIEARILRETLTRLKWNKSRSAAELGLSRVGLRAKLDRYGIAQPQTEEA